MAAERKMDPIPRMRAYLEKKGWWNEQKQTALISRVDAAIKQAVEIAEKTAAPALETMFDDVYAERPWHLREQYEECLRAPRVQGHGAH
jgi:TPP-dependent pyruvate/acetoin dehydrogenase alpha subunit